MASEVLKNKRENASFRVPRSFLKLCRDTGLLDDSFSAVDADLIFAKATQKGHELI